MSFKLEFSPSLIVGMFLIVLILYVENPVASQELLAKTHPCEGEIINARLDVNNLGERLNTRQIDAIEEVLSHSFYRKTLHFLSKSKFLCYH